MLLFEQFAGKADVQWHVLKELAARQAGADLDHFVVVVALQAVVLLQVVQLYGVLAALAPDPSTGQGPGSGFQLRQRNILVCVSFCRGSKGSWRGPWSLRLARKYFIESGPTPRRPKVPFSALGAARESFWERTYVDALQLNLAQAQDSRTECFQIGFASIFWLVALNE